MSLLDDIKAKADHNDDGKATKEDLESLRDGNNDGVIDKLKSMADQSGDGKVSLDDVKSIDLGATFGDIKNKLF